uniref:Uncharacterized protein n=1 Tax=Arundo donax TaxID=35708 RepID=A0A0A9A2Z6_ARUDO
MVTSNEIDNRLTSSYLLYSKWTWKESNASTEMRSQHFYQSKEQLHNVEYDP